MPKTEKLSRCTVFTRTTIISANFQEPSSTEVLGHVADMSRADFVRAIEIADKGFRKYSTSTTFAERGIQLRKWFDLVHANLDDCIKYFPIVLTGSGKDSES